MLFYVWHLVSGNKDNEREDEKNTSHINVSPTFQKQIRNFGQFSFDMWLYVFLSRNPNNSIFFWFIRLNVSLVSLGPQTPNVKFWAHFQLLFVNFMVIGQVCFPWSFITNWPSLELRTLQGVKHYFSFYYIVHLLNESRLGTVLLSRCMHACSCIAFWP